MHAVNDSCCENFCSVLKLVGEISEEMVNLSDDRRIWKDIIYLERYI